MNTEKKKAATDAQKKSWLWEFSKRIVVVVSVLYSALMLFSAVFIVINPDSSAAEALVVNISDVFKITVISYALKAGMENCFKIRRSDEC